jgi:hypothetical protein
MICNGGALPPSGLKASARIVNHARQLRAERLVLVDCHLDKQARPMFGRNWKPSGIGIVM